MLTLLEEQAGRGLRLWVEGVRRRPAWILLVCLLLAVGAAVHAVGHLGVEGDTDELFDADLPFRIYNDELQAAFPSLDEDLLVVIDAPSRSQAEDAVRAVAARVEREPELFESVFTPGVGTFFDRNGLLYLEIGELEDLGDRLAQAQPFLAEVVGDPSLRGLFDLLTRALEEGAAPGSDGGGFEPVFDVIAGSLTDAQRLESVRRSFGDLVLTGAEPGDGVRRFVIVSPHFDFAEFVATGDAFPRLRAILDELGFANGSTVRARITGEMALQAEELDHVKRQAAGAGVASFLMVSAILGLALRSPRVIASALLSLIVGLLWTSGFAAVAVGRLNLISVSFAVLFIGLGVDFGIHFCLRYQELRSRAHGHAEALAETAGSVGGSLVLCASTTAIGFFAFAPTAYVGVAELGIISGGGMLISLLATMTVLPACLSLGARKAVPAAGAELPLPAFGARHPGFVCGSVAVLAVLAFGLALRWRFDPSPLRVRDPNTESVQTFEELIAGGELNPWNVEIVSLDLDAAGRLAGQLRELPSVERVETLESFVPEDQAEKLEVIDDVSLFLEPTLAASPLAPPSTGERAAALRRFQDALQAAREAGEAPEPAAARLAVALDRFLAEPGPDARTLEILEEALVGSILDEVTRLRAALRAAAVGLEDLPRSLRLRMLAPDGRARVQVYPREDLNDDQALERFVAEVRRVAPRATGSSVYMFDSAQVVVGALYQALLSALLLVALLLWLLWRNGRDALLALTPLLLAALFTAALAVVVGLPINFADVIVLPLLLGIGVDSGIHLVHRHRHEGESAEALLRTSTSRAVLWSALTTIASFGSLGFASHRGMATLGQLLTLGVTVTLLCNLVVLPALLGLVESLPRRTARE